MAVFQSIRNFFFSTVDYEPERIIPAPFTTYDVHSIGIADIDVLLRLNLRCFRNGENYTKQTFRYLLMQPQSLAYAAVTPNGDMAGFVLVMNNPNGAAHITTVGVAPEHRRRGIANMLIQHVDQLLRAKGVSTVVLEVRISNLAAQNLYISNGYYVGQRMINYYSNGEDGYLMMKSLD